MMINVTPGRFIRSADELKKTEKTLMYAGYSIEETISSLKRSEDESMLMTASKLSNMLENLQKEIKVARTVAVALDRIAEAYTRTENSVISFEDETYNSKFMRYKTMDISGIREKTGHVFEKL